MMAIIKAIIRQRFSLITLLIVPIILMFVFFSILKLTASEVGIPIVFVDQENQPIVTELAQELSDVPPFTITIEKEIPWHALERGEVEAVFAFSRQLEEKIFTGKTDQIITWYRHEQSVFDSLLKEQLASHMVNLIVRAEAANIVTKYNENAEWDEVFTFGLKYLGPEPIFQMNFQTYSESKINERNQTIDWLSYVRLIFWIYSMGVIGLFSMRLIKWKKELLLQRLKLIDHAMTKVRIAWLLFVTFVCSFIAIIVFNVFSHSLYNMWYSFDLFVVDLMMILLSAIFILMVTVFVKRKETLIALLLSYTVVSVVFYMLIDYQILDANMWMYVFVPLWVFV